MTVPIGSAPLPRPGGSLLTLVKESTAGGRGAKPQKSYVADSQDSTYDGNLHKGRGTNYRLAPIIHKRNEEIRYSETVWNMFNWLKLIKLTILQTGK